MGSWTMQRGIWNTGLEYNCTGLELESKPIYLDSKPIFFPSSHTYFHLYLVPSSSLFLVVRILKILKKQFELL